MADKPDPAKVADTAVTFCKEYDNGDDALRTVLAVDAEHDSWTFDELPLDSGTFGELVSRDIVTKVDGEYRVSSRRGIQAGLEDEEISADRSVFDREFSSPIAFDPRAAVGLVAALGVLFAMRLWNYRSVFRGDEVVSPANDPYYYRYWTEALLAESSGVTDTSVITTLPTGAIERRPLSHSTHWFLAELLGGDQWAADTVAAWLPVVGTVLLGVVVYWLAFVATDDVRIGIASVGILALTPVHAVYTQVGFLEHRLHQYLWLGVTLLTLAWLAVDLQRRTLESTSRSAVTDHLRSPWTWLAGVAFGIALTLSMFAWGGSILMLMPVAAYVGLKVTVDVRAGHPPVLTTVPILVGLCVTGLFAAFLHFHWGWHARFTAIVSLLVVFSAVTVTGFGELWRRLEWSVGLFVGLQVIVAGVGLIAFRYVRPEDWMRLRTRADDLFFREGFAESKSLFAVDNAIIFGPLSQFGLSFYLAILVLGWACWVAYRRYEPGWLLLAVYVVFWLALAAIQGRFAAQLAVPLSVFGGMGLVWLLSWADLARDPVPFRERGVGERDGGSRGARGTAADGGERRPSFVVPGDAKTLVALVWIVLLVCGMSLFFVPSMLGQTTHSDAQFEATAVIDDHAENVDREYPETFVLSEWGDNRMYNYFVNGESELYVYAQATFEEFVTGSDPDGWYEEFAENDVGYVVTTDLSDEYPETSTQAQLHDDRGAGGDEHEPLEHYQAIYLGDDATAFAVVPGATIASTGEPGETVVVETEVTVSGETISYERDVTVSEDGSLEVTVPYAGEYAVGDRTVDVTTAAVENGETVQVE
ncbi:MFS transporter [Natronorubrum sp. FCH18a]|uniref:MFS transporter n=1 Tax=Natronorubrum sp. FCH18a TaxID=3447018 RepID=UPI003F511134